MNVLKQDEKLFNDKKEKYLILLQEISNANNELFTKTVISKLKENLQKLPEIEMIIHLGALSVASAELKIVDVAFLDEVIKHFKKFREV